MFHRVLSEIREDPPNAVAVRDEEWQVLGRLRGNREALIPLEDLWGTIFPTSSPSGKRLATPMVKLGDATHATAGGSGSRTPIIPTWTWRKMPARIRVEGER
jgi:hypothetical protein